MLNHSWCSWHIWNMLKLMNMLCNKMQQVPVEIHNSLDTHCTTDSILTSTSQILHDCRWKPMFAESCGWKTFWHLPFRPFRRRSVLSRHFLFSASVSSLSRRDAARCVGSTTPIHRFQKQRWTLERWGIEGCLVCRCKRAVSGPAFPEFIDGFFVFSTDQSKMWRRPSRTFGATNFTVSLRSEPLRAAHLFDIDFDFHQSANGVYSTQQNQSAHQLWWFFIFTHFFGRILVECGMVYLCLFDLICTTYHILTTFNGSNTGLFSDERHRLSWHWSPLGDLGILGIPIDPYFLCWWYIYIYSYTVCYTSYI